MINFAPANLLKKSMERSEKEDELIQAIRNYRLSYPRGSRQQELYIMDLLYELMEG